MENIDRKKQRRSKFFVNKKNSVEVSLARAEEEGKRVFAKLGNLLTLYALKLSCNEVLRLIEKYENEPDGMQRLKQSVLDKRNLLDAEEQRGG